MTMIIGEEEGTKKKKNRKTFPEKKKKVAKKSPLSLSLAGNLDAVSTLLSNFFVAAYALVNFSVFHATITKQPGWRPSFKVEIPATTKEKKMRK